MLLSKFHKNNIEYTPRQGILINSISTPDVLIKTTQSIASNYHRLIEYNGILYAIGGGNTYDKVYKLNDTTKDGELDGTLPMRFTGSSETAVFIRNNKLYAITCSQTGSTSSSCYLYFMIYDGDTGTSNRIVGTPNITANTHTSYFEYNNKSYIAFAPYVSGGGITEIYELNADDSVTQVSSTFSLSTLRSSISDIKYDTCFGVINGVLYAGYGYTGGRAYGAKYENNTGVTISNYNYPKIPSLVVYNNTYITNTADNIIYFCSPSDTTTTGVYLTNRIGTLSGVIHNNLFYGASSDTLCIVKYPGNITTKIYEV